MRRLGILLTSSVAVAVALLAGCGEGDTADPTRTGPPPQTTSDGQPVGSSPATAPPSSAQPESRPKPLAARAESVVRRYYAAVDSSRFRAAWSLLSPALKADQGGFAAWRDGYATTTSTLPSGIETVNAENGTATVALNLAATDVDACGQIVDQTFAGTWTIGTFGGQLLGTAFDVEKLSGATPVLDASACSSGPAPVPLTQGCDPNYTGCVPPYPPDVDCIDVRETVEVIGDDVHNLDFGGDETACEIW